MQFVASAITVVICVAIMLGFRQLDKNNQSIEKTKRYADRIQANFEVFVKEKTDGLTEVAGELQAQQSQAVAAVKRLDGIYAEFMKKAENLEERAQVIKNIENHVERSEQTIQKLMDMTNLAEKNLAQIGKEADFVDTLAKSIHSAKSELNQIAESIPEMQSRFAEESSSRLEEYKTEILKQMQSAISDIENRLSQSQKSSEDLLEVTAIKLNDLYKKSFSEAANNARELEDEAFKKLKEESIERVRQYRQDLAEHSDVFESEIKKNLSETKDLATNFKTAWKDEASKYVEQMKTDFAEIENSISARTEALVKRVDQTEGEVLLQAKNLTASIKDKEEKVSDQIGKVVATLQDKIGDLTKYSDKRLSEFKTQTDYKLRKFEQSIIDFDKVELQLEKALKTVQNDVLENFEIYKKERQAGFVELSSLIDKDTNTLKNKIIEIEKSLGDLKSKAYNNVSEKLKVFEDEFFTDISKRSESINSGFESWKNKLEEKLTLIAFEQESARKDIEDKYKKDLQIRLAEIGEAHKARLSGFDKQIKDIEMNLSGRLASTDSKMMEYTSEFQMEVDKAKENAHKYMQTELEAYKGEIQETIKNYTKEIETNAKTVNSLLDDIKEDSKNQIDTIKGNFNAWKATMDNQFNDARNLFDDKISNFSSLAENAIVNFNKKYDNEYEAFIEKSGGEFNQLQERLHEVDQKITFAKQDIIEQSIITNKELQDQYDGFSDALDKKIKSGISEADKIIQQIEEKIYSVQTEIENSRSGAMESIQTDTARMTESINKIEEKQKEFINNTKVFERADELKSLLESDISKLQSEISRLDVYSNAMDDLGLKYEKVTHLQEDASNKIAKFMDERSKVEILEQEFTKLATLSDSIEKKQLELAASNDDMQQYQVQIRKLEESISNVNTRYDYLEKKGAVLDQTTNGIDTAFENLKTIETSIKEFKKNITNIPSEIERLQRDMENLLANRDSANEILESVGNINEILLDLDSKMKTLQSSRDWLASTETRLQDLSADTENQIKLMASLFNTKDEGPRNPNEGLSIAERENVILLHRKGWSISEIAGAMKCSYGEVELILEMSDKYEK